MVLLRPTRRRGFTLVEALVTLAVLGLTLSLGVPALAALGDRAKMWGLSSDMLGHLRFARSEAIKRNARVALCKSADGASCAEQGGWEQGWIVFQDRDNDGLRSAGEPLIQVMAPLPGGWRLAGNANVARYISFRPDGGTHLVSGGFQAGTLTLCRAAAGATQGNQVIINANGRPRLQVAALASCP
jgi:type IV fimbrial biogenesis protein FimT